MRAIIFAAVSLGTVAVSAAAADDPATVAAPQGAHYSSSETPIGILLDDPAARAILERRVPGLLTHPQLDRARTMTLKEVQPFSSGRMTDAFLAQVDADFQQLPARSVSPPLTLAATNYQVSGPLQRPTDAQLTWSDEFEGNRIDPGKWVYDTSRNKQGWYNKEQQYYAADRPENARVANGSLIITARAETLSPRNFSDWGGQHYTSAKLMTRGKASWTYGFYEIRAKLPCARGTWPAIWMMPDSGGWPDAGEIDILEHVGSQPNVVHATIHSKLFNHPMKTQRGASLAVPTSCSAFHRYQLDWRADAITIGVDDQAYMRVGNDQPGGRDAWPFDRPFHMILNLAIGGDWAGDADDASMPQTMEIDYVRVWQRPRS